MIKLPQLNMTADADSGLTTAAATGEKGLSDGFLDLFNKALPGLGTPEDGKTLSLSAALNKATGQDFSAQDAAAGKTTLADLLNKLDRDKPGALSSLLASVGKAAGADKTEQTGAAQEATHDLSTADMQALSALFAMLPQQNTATPAATLTSTSGKDTDEASPLSALLAGNGVQQKTTAGRADDSLSAAGKTQTADTTFAAKSVAPQANQVADDSALPIVAVDKESRDNALSNNTTPTVSTPTISSATASTPLSMHIATPVAPQISAQLGSQEWQQAVSQHVTLFTRQGQQSAELRLHPEDLGQIQISLKLDDNQAQLQMTSPHSHVRAALEATLPALRTALAESGIQLGQSNISSESFAQQQQQSGQQQQQSQRSAGSFPSLGGEAESLAVPASVQRLASSNNAVDIFA